MPGMRSGGNCPWRQVPEGLVVAVRLTPRGGRDALGAVDIMADGRAVLTARVRAAPTEGEANRALIRLVACELKIPASRVSISHGMSSRIKMVLVEGDGSELEKKLGNLRGC